MTLAALRAEMTRLAKRLPEYDTVRAMYGVGETTAAQLMAEIGDVRRFPAAVLSWVSPVLIRLWINPASTKQKALQQPSAVLRIFGKRCTKSSALT